MQQGIYSFKEKGLDRFLETGGGPRRTQLSPKQHQATKPFFEFLTLVKTTLHPPQNHPDPATQNESVMLTQRVKIKSI